VGSSTAALAPSRARKRRRSPSRARRRRRSFPAGPPTATCDLAGSSTTKLALAGCQPLRPPLASSSTTALAPCGLVHHGARPSRARRRRKSPQRARQLRGSPFAGSSTKTIARASSSSAKRGPRGLARRLRDARPRRPPRPRLRPALMRQRYPPSSPFIGVHGGGGGPHACEQAGSSSSVRVYAAPTLLRRISQPLLKSRVCQPLSPPKAALSARATHWAGMSQHRRVPP